jgi:hypothetical protein
MFLTPPTKAGFQFAEAKSPRLRIVTYSDAARACVVRGITQKGLIHFPLTTNALRTAENWDVPLTELPLAVTIETTTAATQRGQLYAAVYLQFAGVNSVLLISGYVTLGQRLSWPEGTPESPTAGRGALLEIAVADPGAGGDLLQTVPTNTIWRTRGLRCRFDTNATVADRELILLALDSTGGPMGFHRPTITQPASTTYYYHFQDYKTTPATYSLRIASPFQHYYLPAGASITSDIQNLKGGDAVTFIVLYVEQWLSP